MLLIEYFGNLEHSCFKKNVFSDFFSRSVDFVYFIPFSTEIA